MSLLVTGTIGIDTVQAPTGSRENVLGGSCTYFAAAASFFSPVRLVAVAGDDLPEEHLRVFEHFRRIDTDGLEVRQGSKTFRWGCAYADDMNERETLFTDLNVLEEAPPKVPASYHDSKFIFLANSHPSIQMDLLRQISAPTLVVADTMDLWINIARDELTELMQHLDGLVLNDQEARLLTDERNLRAAADRILEFGPRFVVIKKGEHGVVMVHRDGIAVLPAYPMHSVIDPTGAGDSFAGGMMGWVASEDDAGFEALRRGLARGTVIASFTCESFTLDRLLTLTSKEVSARLEEFGRMCCVE